MRLAYIHTPESRSYSRGFTIVELLIVIVVIAILAAISLIAFSAVQTNTAKAVLQSDLKQASKDLDLAQVREGHYPGDDTNLSRSEGTNYEYDGGGDSYCLTAWSTAARASFHISNNTGSVQEGACSGHTGYTGGGSGQIPANQGVVTTLAGSTSGDADGTGAAAQFNIPTRVAVDTVGTVYVADAMNHRIRKISPSGVVTTLAGTGTAGYTDGIGTAAQFDTPIGIAVDSSGHVYVADTMNHRIRKISPVGEVSTAVGSGPTGINGGGYVDGSNAVARLDRPFGVAVGNNGDLYIADYGNVRIRTVSPSGGVSTLAGGTWGFTDGFGSEAQFREIYDVTVDGLGAVYVADQANHAIRKISPDGVVTTLAGSGTPGFVDGVGSAAQFAAPIGVTVDSAGNVYVADAYNHRIRKISADGTVSTLAGSGAPLGEVGGFRDGTGSDAEFYVPYGVAVDSAGTVYVADAMNHRIRKIE